MSFNIDLPLIGHVVILNDAQKAVVDQALAAAGHDVVSFVHDEISTLWAEVQAKFPELVTSIKQGIADFENKSMSGGEKAVAVAMDVMKVAPAVLQALPNAKDFFVHAVTQVYADGLSALKTEAAALIGKL